MNRKFFVSLFLFCSWFLTEGVCQENKTHYKSAFDEIKRMLGGEQCFSFKRAVFITENAFLAGKLNYDNFCKEIETINERLKQFVERKSIQHYKTAYHYAAFSYITDSIPENNYQPCGYDFDDFLGRKNYENMFVTKLLRTKKGNCHSLPYLYKIMCDEVGAESFLAIAPNHCYIKHKDEQGKWVNIELTNRSSPRDQWMIQQMNISAEAIRSGAYMEALSKQQTLATCLFDLALGYKTQFGFDDFYLDIVEEALKYYPNSIELTSQQADYHVAKVEEAKQEKDLNKAKTHYEQFQILSKRMVELGYKEETPEQYEQWVQSVEAEKAKQATLQSK